MHAYINLEYIHHSLPFKLLPGPPHTSFPISCSPFIVNWLIIALTPASHLFLSCSPLDLLFYEYVCFKSHVLKALKFIRFWVISKRGWLSRPSHSSGLLVLKYLQEPSDQYPSPNVRPCHSHSGEEKSRDTRIDGQMKVTLATFSFEEVWALSNSQLTSK